jgi:hypothetical protein
MLELNRTIIALSDIIADQMLLPISLPSIQLNVPYRDRSTVKENQKVCSPVLTDRIIKNSDRATVEENQMICSPF